MNPLDVLRRRPRAQRILGWAAILALMAWVPSCDDSPKNPAPTEAVVIDAGDPIDSPLEDSGSPAGTDSARPAESATGKGAAPSNNSPLIVGVSKTPSPDLPAGAVEDVKSIAPAARDGYAAVSFAFLSSYEYHVPDPFEMQDLKPEEMKKLSEQIPEYVRKLNQQKVMVTGFMVPLDVGDEGVKSFILTYNRMMCCFGQMPWYNEWVFVEMPLSKPATFFNDIPVTVTGSLDVGEEIEDGFVISLYRMKGEEVVEAPEESLNPAGR